MTADVDKGGRSMGDLPALKAQIERALSQDGGTAAVIAVCAACAHALPCDGAAITVMTSDSERETVFAADPVIADLENRQYDVGEGPSLQAFSTGRPVLVPDLQTVGTSALWPGLLAAVGGQPVRGVFSFPMRFGAINVGVCTFYRHGAGTLDAEDLRFVLDALDLTTLALLALREGEPAESILGRWLAVAGNNRREVHQATGMLIGQLGVTAEVAFARLRGYAFAAGTDVEQVAADIVARRLRLPVDADPEALPGRGL